MLSIFISKVDQHKRPRRRIQMHMAMGAKLIAIDIIQERYRKSGAVSTGWGGLGDLGAVKTAPPYRCAIRVGHKLRQA